VAKHKNTKHTITQTQKHNYTRIQEHSRGQTALIARQWDRMCVFSMRFDSKDFSFQSNISSPTRTNKTIKSMPTSCRYLGYLKIHNTWYVKDICFFMSCIPCHDASQWKLARKMKWQILTAPFPHFISFTRNKVSCHTKINVGLKHKILKSR